MKEAIEMYVQSLRDLNFELEDFMRTMEEDRSMLVRNGINEKDIALMMDYLHYRLSS